MRLRNGPIRKFIKSKEDWYAYYWRHGENHTVESILDRIKIVKSFEPADMRHLNKLYPDDKEPALTTKKGWLKFLDGVLKEAINDKLDM
jgi:hypothetical protein